jgi:predicted dehydrogenase
MAGSVPEREVGSVPERGACVRIGILGAARIAPKAVVVPARTIPEAEIVAVAARDRSRAQEFADKHGIPRVHADYATLLADDEIDAVYNPLPNGLHGEWTIAALEAGKHVLCEKPFTANAIEAQVVADVAARTGKVVMEAFHYRYHPLFARVLELVGTLGALDDISARMIAILPNRHDVRYQLDLAGGAAMDVGCYAIHQIRSVAASEPQVISARGTSLSPGIDRAMRASFTFTDGSTASMECALLEARAPIADLRIIGERGRVHVHFPTRPELAWITTRAGSVPERKSGGTTRRERVRGEPTFWYQLQAFCGAVLRNEPILTGPADAVATMRVIDAVYEASGLGPRQPSR